MRRAVSSLWIGPSLSLVEQLTIKSFLDHGHPFQLYTYGPVANVPTGTILLDANEIIPEADVYRTKVSGLAAFSDWFRYAMLAKKGGMWVDMDLVCLKPFDFTEEIAAAFERPNGDVGTSALAFPAGHEFMRYMAAACDDVNMVHGFDTPAAKAKKFLRGAMFGKKGSRAKVRYSEPGGPPYLTRQMKHHGLFDAVKPHYWFFPFSMPEWRKIYEPYDAVAGALKNSYGLHLWNNVLDREKDVDKNSRAFADALIGRLLDKHLPR